MNGNKMATVITIIVVIILAFIFISMAQPDPYRQSYGSGGTNSVKDFLSKDSNFTFHTAKSEPGESTKAYIFSTSMSVPEAAKYIKDNRTPFDSSDMNSTDKIILTYDDEYAIVYSIDNDEGQMETFVQTSTRQYAYKTYNRGLYHPYRSTVVIPFPVYYERTYYNTDRERYGSYRSTGSSSSSNKSVRTGSTGSSNSRGGGTSVGK